MWHRPFDSVLGWLRAEGVVTETADPDDITEVIYDGEEALLSTALPRRKREFRAGRVCARRVLAQLGVFDSPLLAGRHGEPIWPVGFTGSISHCDDYCVVVATRVGHVLSIGLDVENADAVPERIGERICTPDESVWIRSLPDGERRQGLAVLFSVKECVYKCLYPITGWQLDFKEVDVLVDSCRGAFAATARGVVPGTHMEHLEGRFAISGSHVLTAVTVPGVTGAGEE